jgi:hypothetical protein
MKRICPYPALWNEVFMLLTNFAKKNPWNPSSPTKPLILAGWVHSNDRDKKQRWEETMVWAKNNICADLIPSSSDSDFYFAE